MGTIISSLNFAIWGRGGHIFYILGLYCRCIALWTLIHFTSDAHKAKCYIAPKMPGFPAVKECLLSLFLWCWLNSECLAPRVRCTQQLFIPVSRILAPGLSFSMQAGWVFVVEWKLFYCTDYFNTVMLSLWHVTTAVSTIMTTTNKYIWKSHRCIQKEPKEVTLTLQNLDISCIFVFGVSFLQSRDPASNYQPSIRVH